MRIKTGYQAIIVSGKYKGSVGKIISVCQKTCTVKIEKVNMKIKHVKPQQNDEKGYIKKIEGSIHQSNIKIKSSTNKT